MVKPDRVVPHASAFDFVEDETYSYAHLKEVFGEDNVDQVVEDLSRHNVLILLKSTSGSKLYKFNYVGIFTYDRAIFRVGSKISRSENPEIFDNLFRVSLSSIISYFDNNKMAVTVMDDLFIDPFGPLSCSTLALAREIVEDFEATGVYQVRLKSFGIDGLGDIDWDRTLECFLPTLTPSGPIYDRVATVSSNVDQTNNVRLLHAKIVNSAYELLYNLGLSNILSPSLSVTDELYDSVSPESDTLLLNRCMRSTFNDILLNKLRLCLAYIQTVLAPTTSTINFLGCRKFHVVWEESCKKVVGDKFEDRYHKGTWRESRTGRISFGQTLRPQWSIGSTPGLTDSSLKPDIVTFERRSEGSTDIHVFDAKYYDLLGRGRSPGASDIAKQHAYELGFTCDSDEISMFSNSLLFPALVDGVLSIGSVSIPSFAAVGCVPINVIALPFGPVLEAYSNRRFERIRNELMSSVKAWSSSERLTPCDSVVVDQ